MQDFDLQNNPRQTMDFDLPTTPQFSVGGEVAAFIASCGILLKAWEEIYTCNSAWEEITSRNNVDYFVNENEVEGVAYVTFPSSSTEDFIVSGSSRYGEYDIKNEKIFYDCLKGDHALKPALVHEGALNRFRRILQRPDFQKEMKGLKAQTIIFVGHSMGGAVAALASLFYLQKRVRGKSYFCITFGSPLVGNAVLGEAIGGQDWVGKFCHVVSNFDIVPRMLLAPFDSIVDHLNEVTPHWGNNGMSTGSVAVTSLVERVLPYTSDMTSPYRPFGTYMFCSTKGAACIDDSEAVLKMLHFTMQGIPLDQYVDTCASYHTGYGKMLEAVTVALINATPFANSATDPFEVGIALELEAMAVGAQNHDASIALKESGQKKNKQDMNIMKLNEELSEMQSHMAQVEWYKAACKRRCGYYDSFKQQKERRDMKVNIYREKLERFWKEDIVEKSEKHVLPSDLRSRNKWINAGTAYRRLVEPLDIANHYRTPNDTTSYLSDEVRPQHHKVVEKWLKEKEQTRGDRGKKDRTMFASLTSDSCFWARIEDSSLALATVLKMNDPFQDMKDLMPKHLEFLNSIWNMIKDKSVSEEVFLEGSSFKSWWELSKRFMTLWERLNPSRSPSQSTDPLDIFMQNKENNS